MIDALLLLLSVITVHRVWNYEQIFQPIRQKFQRFKVATCPACNAFWIGFGLIFAWWGARKLGLEQPARWGMGVLACYAAIRFVTGFYSFVGIVSHWFIRPSGQHQHPPAVPPSPSQKSTCAQRKQALLDQQRKNLTFDKRVVLLTTLGNFEASYSLSSVILDHARALAMTQPKCKVEVWVMQTAHDALWPDDMPVNVELRKVVPSVSWRINHVDEKAKGIWKNGVLRELMLLGNATIFTHDLLFQEHFQTAAAALHEIGALKGFKWFHVAHSGPSERPAEEIARFRCTLPEGDHSLMILAECHREGFKKMYRTEKIVTVPNVRNLCTIFNDQRALEIITKAGLAHADIVQTFPISTPRWQAKGVDYLIDVFGALKAGGKSVRLIIPNAHANNNEKCIAEMRKIAERAGLDEGDLRFTSELYPETQAVGLTGQQVALLFQHSNLFIFPTVAEASSLILLEAALSCSLLVLNEDVPSLFDIVPKNACLRFSRKDSPAKVAKEIIDIWHPGVAWTAKQHVLKEHSLGVLGQRLASLF
jgi:hypothetical protein